MRLVRSTVRFQDQWQRFLQSGIGNEQSSVSPSIDLGIVGKLFMKDAIPKSESIGDPYQFIEIHVEPGVCGLGSFDESKEACIGRPRRPICKPSSIPVQHRHLTKHMKITGQ